jgi:hypothetical protein
LSIDYFFQEEPGPTTHGREREIPAPFVNAVPAPGHVHTPIPVGTILAFLGNDGIFEEADGQSLSGDLRVVSPVESDGLDVGQQSASARIVEGGFEHDRVVAVRPLDGPTEGDAVAVSEDRPLPSELRSICRILARSLN